MWKSPRLNGARPLKQSLSRSASAATAVLLGARPAPAGRRRQLGLHRRDADPVLLLDLGVVRVVERVGVLDRVGVPPRGVEARAQPVGEAGAQRSRAASLLGAGHVGEVVEAADQVDGVVELLLAHALALDVAEALGPAVLVGVELVGDVAQGAVGEVVEVVAEAVVARPAPDERDRARELDRLVGVARVGVGAEVDRAVGDDLVRDLAGASR